MSGRPAGLEGLAKQFLETQATNTVHCSLPKPSPVGLAHPFQVKAMRRIGMLVLVVSCALPAAVSAIELPQPLRGQMHHTPPSAAPGQAVGLRTVARPFANLKNVRMYISSRGYVLDKPCVVVKSPLQPRGRKLMEAGKEYSAKAVVALLRGGEACMVEVSYFASTCEEAAVQGDWCSYIPNKTALGYLVGSTVTSIEPRAK